MLIVGDHDLLCLLPDVNVQVACLTCYGAVISISPRHVEVEQWLSSAEDSAGAPWLFQHCISLLQIQSEPDPMREMNSKVIIFLALLSASIALQTEALQVLAALAKFYFPQISGCWQQLKDFYLSHLASFPHGIQQHVLKVRQERGSIIVAAYKLFLRCWRSCVVRFPCIPRPACHCFGRSF